MSEAAPPLFSSPQQKRRFLLLCLYCVLCMIALGVFAWSRQRQAQERQAQTLQVVQMLLRAEPDAAAGEGRYKLMQEQVLSQGERQQESNGITMNYHVELGFPAKTPLQLRYDKDSQTIHLVIAAPQVLRSAFRGPADAVSGAAWSKLNEEARRAVVAAAGEQVRRADFSTTQGQIMTELEKQLIFTLAQHGCHVRSLRWQLSSSLGGVAKRR